MQRLFKCMWTDRRIAWLVLVPDTRPLFCGSYEQASIARTGHPWEEGTFPRRESPRGCCVHSVHIAHVFNNIEWEGGVSILDPWRFSSLVRTRVT